MDRKERLSKAVLFAVPIVLTILGFQYQQVANQLSAASRGLAHLAVSAPLLFGVFLTLFFGVFIAVAYLAAKYLLEPTGIKDAKTTRYFSNRNSAEYRHELEKLFASAKKVDVVGIGNSQFTSDASLEFYESLLCTQRCTVRVLFLDPEGDQVSVREHDEEHAPKTLSTQVYKHLSYIMRFMSQLEQTDPVARSLFQYKFYDRYPSCNMIIFDRETVLVQHYLYSTRGSVSPIYSISGGDSWMVKFYLSEFDQLWEVSRSPTPEELTVQFQTET